MARPVSTKATFKYRIEKSVAKDIEDLHWILRRDTAGTSYRRRLLTMSPSMLPSQRRD